MLNGELIYIAVMRLIDEYAHFNNSSDYEKFVMELATIFEI